MEDLSKDMQKTKSDLLKFIQSHLKHTITKYQMIQLEKDFSSELITMMALKPQPSWVELAKQIEGSTEISLWKRWTDMRKCAGRKFAKTWENSLTEREDLAEAVAAVLSKKKIQLEESRVMG